MLKMWGALESQAILHEAASEKQFHWRLVLSVMPNAFSNFMPRY